jgi:hypothetical protein
VSKSGGSSTQTVEQKQSPQQQALTNSLMQKYMPGGKLVSKGKDGTVYQGGTFQDKPTFSQAQIQAAGNEKVAGFNSDQLRAFQETRDSAFSHRPTMDAAIDATKQSMTGPTGQKQTLGTGWSTDANGNAKFADFNADTLNSFMSPYTSMVTTQGLADLERQRQQMIKGNGDAAAAAQAFGGGRHGVVEAQTNRGVADASARFVADTYDKGYGAAVNQYNTAFNQGQTALAWNKGIEDDFMSRLQQGGAQLGDLAKQGQDLDGKSIDALAQVGAQQQNQDQLVKDTGYDSLMDNYLWAAKMAQMMSGFLPAGSTTSTASQNNGGSIWGSVGSAALGTIGQALIPMLSDERAKKDVKDADTDESLEAIRKLKPVKYKYTDEARDQFGEEMAPSNERVGFMAQDLESATGEASGPDIGGFKSVDIMQHMGRLTHALQALANKVDRLEAA